MLTGELPLNSKAPTKFDYSNEPIRSSELIVQKDLPFNAEPPLKSLIQHYITPTELFFKRNHGPIPLIDGSTYVFKVDGLVEKPIVVDLHSLKTKFQKHEVAAVIQCAGNRRDGLANVKKVKGVIWGPGTVGNAVWGGARLSDVLKEAGVPMGLASQLHVAFEAYGDSEEDTCYGSSIPLEMAINPSNDVLLAYEMNGCELTRDHGFPCRVVVPGVIGARSVKYLSRITIQSEESQSFYQKMDYKVLPPYVDEHNADEWWDKMAALQEMIIQSVICEPCSGQVLPPGPVTIRGYALCGGGKGVDRVDVSLDNGLTWLPTDRYQAATRNKHYAWCLWKTTVDSIPDNCKIICRAFDTCGNTQPEFPIWNFRGVMNNSWFVVENVRQQSNTKL
ncbi:recombinant sulfite oxidase [Basidiobolus meristosporus CBS 931.73]|uniref:Recombinant sulfite oxidase n=1 Tax=Basidiobolus meristosporus CBS 931.73 TaxID=1314790 RepID=A0A1Y1Z896_9FUNG|nr:recombinant sulfite oxidase [Basidiobolus meristosporus CBS 931.73]|eukprot:ORY06334.1 recombinant sulfite oxidase [Basidiobolus meristosporus CBS 931.73]